MFNRIVAAACMSVLLSAPALAQGPREISAQGKLAAESAYRFTYGPAEQALRCAFQKPDFYATFRQVAMTWTPTIHPAVKHLAEVDGPVHGGRGPRQDPQALCTYLKSTNHPQNGNVTGWYLANFTGLVQR